MCGCVVAACVRVMREKQRVGEWVGWEAAGRRGGQGGEQACSPEAAAAAAARPAQASAARGLQARAFHPTHLRGQARDQKGADAVQGEVQGRCQPICEIGVQPACQP